MTQDEFDKAPLLDQILYDCTGMLVKNHLSIAESMQKYADQQLILPGTVVLKGALPYLYKHQLKSIDQLNQTKASLPQQL